MGIAGHDDGMKSLNNQGAWRFWFATVLKQRKFSIHFFPRLRISSIVTHAAKYEHSLETNSNQCEVQIEPTSFDFIILKQSFDAPAKSL